MVSSSRRMNMFREENTDSYCNTIADPSRRRHWIQYKSKNHSDYYPLTGSTRQLDIGGINISWNNLGRIRSEFVVRSTRILSASQAPHVFPSRVQGNEWVLCFDILCWFSSHQTKCSGLMSLAHIHYLLYMSRTWQLNTMP